MNLSKRSLKSTHLLHTLSLVNRVHSWILEKLGSYLYTTLWHFIYHLRKFWTKTHNNIKHPTANLYIWHSEESNWIRCYVTWNNMERKSIAKCFYVPETPTDFSVFCTHSQLASEIICLNRRDRTSQGGLVGSRNVGISRMQLLDTYRGVEASLYLQPHLVNGAYQTWGWPK